MLKLPTSNHKLALGSFSVIITSLMLIAIPALAQTILTLFLILFHTQLSLESTVGLLSNMWWINLIPKVIGLTVLVAVVVRSRLQVDSSKVKRQLMKASVVGLLGLFLVCMIYVEVPVAKAETVATTGYILDTPLPIADWYVGKYSTNNYFAINGSNWDNLMAGVGSTAWASYTSNYTKVEELVLGQITYGQVYLKEVPFNYNLTIPANVKVIENVNGLTREFISSASSQGSPYTISVDKINTQYYMAQDSANRFINSFTSTNYSSIVNNAFNALTSGRTWKETVILTGNATLTNSLLIPSYTKLIVDGSIFLANSANCDVIKNAAFSTGNTQIEITGSGSINGNYLNQVSQYSDVLGHQPAGIKLVNVSYSDVYGLAISNCLKSGVQIVSSQNVNVKNNLLINTAMNYQYNTAINVYVDGLLNSNDISVIGNQIVYTVNPAIDMRSIGIYTTTDTACKLQRVIVSDNFVNGNNLANIYHGIEISGSPNAFTANFPTITDVTVTNNQVYGISTAAGIDFNGVSGLTVSSNTIKNVTGPAIAFSYASKSTVSNNIISNTIDAISLGHITGSISITGNIINASSRYGIVLYEYQTEPNKDCIISNNAIDNSGTYAICTTPTGYATNKVTVSSNIIRNATSAGIYLNLGNNCPILGNSISGTSTGIQFQSVTNSIISNNLLWNISAGGFAVLLDGGSYNAISSNQIDWTYEWSGVTAFYLAGSTYNSITGNIVKNGNIGTTLTDTSSYNTITGNQFTVANYPIRETAGDYNVITANIGNSANIMTVGTHTQVHLCYNGTVWIP